MSGQDDIRRALLADGGELQVNLAPEIDPIPLSLFEGILLDLLTQINAANGTRHFVRPSDDRDLWYEYTTRNRHYKLGAAVDASLDASVQHVTGVDGWRVTADNVINQQKATVDWPEFPLTPITVWEYDALPPLPLTILAGAPLVLTATFSDYVLSCPDIIIASTGDTLAAQLAHHGWDSEITLTSEGTTQVTQLSLLGRQAERLPEITYTKDDVASQAFPRGIRAGPQISGDFVGALASARGIAQHIVWRYPQPLKRPTVVVENWLPTALRWDLYDLFDFTSVQLKAEDVVFEVVGISEEVRRAADNGEVHIVTAYTLQESRLQTTYDWFVMDASELDSDHHLGY